MIQKTLPYALATVAALAFAAPNAAAQDGAARPGRSLAIGALGDPSIGVWFRASENADVGLEVAASTFSRGDDDDVVEQDGWNVELRPALKLFVPQRGPFRPYTYGEVFYAREEFSLTVADTEIDGAERWSVGAGLGIGMDWQVASRFSVGGHAGVRAAYDADEIDGEESDGWNVRTFDSGIRAHLYI